MMQNPMMQMMQFPQFPQMMQFPMGQMPMMKGFEDWQKMGQANMEASMKALGEWTKGWQTIAVEMNDYTKRAMENHTAHMEKLMAVKSVEQAMELQQNFAKRSYEDYMAQVTKVNSLCANLAKEAYKPVERAMNQPAA